jgi:hypothetical protein
MREVHAKPLGEYPLRDRDEAESELAEESLIPVELLFPRLPRKLRGGYTRQAIDAALERLAGEFRWFE